MTRGGTILPDDTGSFNCTNASGPLKHGTIKNWKIIYSKQQHLPLVKNLFSILVDAYWLLGDYVLPEAHFSHLTSAASIENSIDRSEAGPTLIIYVDSGEIPDIRMVLAMAKIKRSETSIIT